MKSKRVKGSLTSDRIGPGILTDEVLGNGKRGGRPLKLGKSPYQLNYNELILSQDRSRAVVFTLLRLVEGVRVLGTP